MRSHRFVRSPARLAQGIFVLCALCVFETTTLANARGETFVTFDPPGAGTAKNHGTIEVTENSAGDVTGWYVDDSIVVHGFVRTAGGNFTSFNSNQPGESTIRPKSINDAGIVTGYYLTITGFVYLTHGFFRTPDGTFTTFDVPGATGIVGTSAYGMDATGTIVGRWHDASGFTHGFLRSSDGNITSFDVPGANFTEAELISSNGIVAGWYFKSKIAGARGFVRSTDGTIKKFAVPGAKHQGATAASVNTHGDVAGYFEDANHMFHGFIRLANGTITVVDVAGAGNGKNQGTFIKGLNSNGESTGYFTDENHIDHGFLRTAGGTIIPFDGPEFGTRPVTGGGGSAINDSNLIVGTFKDNHRIQHGFFRLP
jgi:hypothetical protein